VVPNGATVLLDDVVGVKVKALVPNGATVLLDDVVGVKVKALVPNGATVLPDDVVGAKVKALVPNEGVVVVVVVVAVDGVPKVLVPNGLEVAVVPKVPVPNETGDADVVVVAAVDDDNDDVKVPVLGNVIIGAALVVEPKGVEEVTAENALGVNVNSGTVLVEVVVVTAGVVLVFVADVLLLGVPN